MTDNRPKYVRELDRERVMAEAELRSLQASLYELRSYLNSPKFRAPSERHNLVNVEDVLLRLDEAGYNAQRMADFVGSQ